MKFIYKVLLAAAPIVFVAACGGGDDLDDRLDVADPQVRLVHAGTLSPAVTLYRNGTAQPGATSLAYRSASNYADVSTTTGTWRVATASGDVTVSSGDVETSRGNRYTFAVVPDASLTGAETLVIRDPYNKSLTSDRARVRVLHAAANTQAPVDVYLTAPGVDLATVGPNFGNVSYKSANPASGNDSLEFPGTTYSITVTAAGSKTPIFRSTASLGSNADWLVTVLPDSATPGDLRLLVVRTNDATPATELGNQLP